MGRLMSNIILLGEENKRYIYFKKAAETYNISVDLLKWEDFSLDKIKGKVKIDPPIYTDKNIKEHSISLKLYRENLKRLSNMENITFLNSPKVILDLLDKEESKERLIKKGIKVTPNIEIKAKNFKEVYNQLKLLKLNRVFIKPRYGSGAMGIIAMKLNFKKDDVILYTTFKESNRELFNTKEINKVFGFEKSENLFNLLFDFLDGELIFEKWLPKDKYENQNYDLRVLYSNKKIVHIIGRASAGPITNLHLNNGSINVEKLNLNEEILKKLEVLGTDIFEIFSDLKVVGADILITPKKEIFVIELNGQGDQLYSDMYNENKIYKEQIKELLNYE